MKGEGASSPLTFLFATCIALLCENLHSHGKKGKTAKISHSGSFGSSPAESVTLISEAIIGLSKIIAKLTAL